MNNSFSIPWIVLSHSGGLRENIVTHETYFDWIPDCLAVGILSFWFLSVDNEYRKNQFTSYLLNYNLHCSKKFCVVNGIKERFQRWLLPVYQFFNFTFIENDLRKIFILPQATGEEIEEGLTAYKNKQKGISTTERNRLIIAFINSYWGIHMSHNKCLVCETHQSVFMLGVDLPICFDCYIGNSNRDSFRPSYKQMFDANGQKIISYARYITPRREIVFFDHEFDQMIHLDGKIELPLETEQLFKL
jgi:hypothetical protein